MANQILPQTKNPGLSNAETWKKLLGETPQELKSTLLKNKKQL